MKGKNIYLILGAILIVSLFIVLHTSTVSANVPSSGPCSTITSCSDGSAVQVSPTGDCGSGYDAVCGDSGYDWCCPSSTTANKNEDCSGVYQYTCSGTHSVTTTNGNYSCVGTAPAGYSCSSLDRDDCIKSDDQGYNCDWELNATTTIYSCSGLNSSTCLSTSGCSLSKECTPCNGAYQYACSGTHIVSTNNGYSCVGTAPAGDSCSTYTTRTTCLDIKGDDNRGSGYNCDWKDNITTKGESCSSINDKSTCASTSGCNVSKTCVINQCADSNQEFTGCTGSFCTGYPTNDCVVTNPLDEDQSSSNCSYLPVNSNGSCTTDATNIGCKTQDKQGYDQCVDDCDRNGGANCYDTCAPAYECTGTATCSPSQCDHTDTTNPSHDCEYNKSIICSSLLNPDCSAAGCTANDCSSITDENTCTSTSGCVNTCSSGGSSSTACTDSDGGLNYVSRGIVTVTNTTDNTQHTWGDSCKDSSTLSEYFCNGNLQGEEDHTCQAGYTCANGACVSPSDLSCSDSDNGLNYTSYGIVTVTNTTDNTQHTWGDLCKDTSTLFEYFCNGNLQGGIDYTCQNGYTCSNGACVTATPSSACTYCNSDADCSSGSVCKQELGSQNKSCVSNNGCAIVKSTDFPNCQASDGTVNCNASSVVICDGTTKTWDVNKTCDGNTQKCSVETTPAQCVAKNPVLYWLQKNGYPLNPANTLSGNPGTQSTIVQLLILYAHSQEQQSQDIIYLNESGLTSNHSILTIPNPVYDSASNSLSYTWSITNDSLTPVGSDHSTNPDQYNFYFNYNGYQSQILNYNNTADTLYCKDGICSPSIGENYTSCSDDCSKLLWREGTSPHSSLNTIVVNNSQIAKNPISLQGYLYGPSSGGVKATFTDYPTKGGSYVFASNVQGVNDSNNLEFPLMINQETVNKWREQAAGKSVIKDNHDDTSNELYHVEVSVDGQKANFSIEIDNVLDCVLDGTSCSTVCQAVTSCSDYTNTSLCNQNPCSTIGTTGNDYSSCSWDTSKNNCNRVESVPNSGTCVYNEETASGTCNTTGQLTYSWTANWTWAKGSSVDPFIATNKDGTVKKGYIKLPNEDNYRYDPNGIYESCQNGTKVLLCPVKAQLSFFNFKNILAAVILIALIYFVLSFKKEKKKVQKKIVKVAKKTSKPKKKMNKKPSKKKK